MLYFEFSLRKFQNLNFHFMKQYSPNSNFIITTYPCIYLYIQQVICYFIVKKLIGYGVWCLDLFGFHVSYQDQLETLFLVGGIGWESTHLAFWNVIPLCLMWCIWNECNLHTFEDMESFRDQLLAFFCGFLFDWFRT